MENTYQFFLSREWWVSVVIFGILINVAASYLKSILDSRLSRISGWWKLRSEKSKAEKAAYIKRLSVDEKFFALNTIRVINSAKWSILWALVGVLGFSVADTMSLILANIVMGVSTIAWIRGAQHASQSDKYYSYAKSAVDVPDDT